MSDFSTFVISLERDHARRDVLRARLLLLKMTHTIFPATCGQTLTTHELSRDYDDERARERLRELGLSEIGCALSHYRVYQTIVEQNLPYALILEDDAILADDTPNVIKALARVLTPDAPTVVLLNFVRRYFTPNPFALTASHTLVTPYGHAVGAFAYVVTHKAAQNLVKALYPVSRPCDLWSEFAQEGIIDLKTIVPYCASIDTAFTSNIDNQRSLVKEKFDYQTRWTQRSRRWWLLLLSFFRPVKKQQKTW